MSIVLIGLPGSGKTTVGKLLSDKLGWNFFDTDIEIERSSGKSIDELFNLGEPYFRDLEEEILKELIKYDKLVIASGGGIVERDNNMKLLRNSYVIFLDRSIDEILNTLDESSRPLLKEDVRGNLNKINKNRRNKYLSLADLIVDEKTPIEVVEVIIRKLSKLIL